MTKARANPKDELLQELEGLPPVKVKEVLDFVCFIKARDFIDPTQAYFWSKKWQRMEKEAEKDIETGRVYGPFNSAKALIRDLEK